MLKTIKILILYSLFVSLILTSCSSDYDPFNEEIENPQNKEYAGTKWIVNDADWSFGDDWIEMTRSTIQVLFFSQTEGLIYMSDHSNSSDTGLYSTRLVSFFKYKVNDGYILLDYITEKNQYMPNSFVIKKGEIIYDSRSLTKKSISSEDRKWVKTICGTTGACKWYYDENKKLYITGNGPMADYKSANSTPWSQDYNELELQKGVTHIGSYAFANKSLCEVNMSLFSLKTIGSYAFAGSCISSVYLSTHNPDNDNLISIGDGAFSECSYLRKVTLPYNIEEIGSYAFYNCFRAEVSFQNTKKIKKIGENAFSGPKVTQFDGTMDALEEIGNGALPNISGKKLILGNECTTINNVSFGGSAISEIKLGTHIKNISGTPFYPAKTGEMYVNLGIPINIKDNIIDSEVIQNWTLYVPKGSRNAYSKAKYWMNFKNIIEDNSLESGNGTPGKEDDDENQVLDKETYFYKIDGVTYKMILVDNGTYPPFRIMQTELPPTCVFEIEDKFIGKLSTTEIVIKANFRTFIDDLRKATGTPFRLPTQQEWILAARGGNNNSTNTYSGGNSINDVAWHKGNSSNMLHKLATKKPNELGIYDMCGNYGEMCNGGEGLNGIDYNIDGYVCGGSYRDEASNCKITSSVKDPVSGTISGTRIKHKSAFDGRYITIRLVYSVKKK